MLPSLSLLCVLRPPHGSLTHSLRLQGVPDVDVEIVVAGQQQAPGPGRGEGGDPAHDA